jgi:3-hydroxybutyryl-CoA dehydrogenase
LRGDGFAGATRDQALARLSFTHDLGDLADRQIVIEAVAENREVKLDVFRQLDKVVTDPAAVLATNTSSIPVVDLAVATGRPAQVVGLHFFNPVPVQKLVEVIPALTTATETVNRARSFVAGQLGKEVIQAPDRSGFVVNALLVPYLLAAIRMVESGAARPEDIDSSMELGCAHPMGPLRLLDLIGLDTAQAVADSMYDEFKEPLYAAPPLLQRMVAAGHLGRKSGRGFYVYEA